MAFHENQQVVAAGHQEKGIHFVELGDPLGDAIESAFAFGLDSDLDDGFDEVGINLVVVNYGFVAEDDLVIFVLFDFDRFCGERSACSSRSFRSGSIRVLQKLAKC
jgi:hypothetical protein